jgi:hypothetical protein
MFCPPPPYFTWHPPHTCSILNECSLV